jgi:hypothetical protein
MAAYPIPLPTSFQEPQPIVELTGELGTSGSDYLREHGFHVWAGFDEVDLPHITRIAGEAAIRNYAWLDETEERFGSPEAAARWVGHRDELLGLSGRALFLLMYKYPEREADRWAGYGMVWPEAPAVPENADPGDIREFSKTLAEARTTWGVRVSERYYQRQLITAFAKVVIAAGNQMYGVRDFWIEAWDSEADHRSAYITPHWEKKLIAIPGRRQLGFDGEAVDDLRLFYTLPDRYLADKPSEVHGPPERYQAIGA